ncbi:hypothetical protein T440DRAFT_438628 [Plenodomus tracheiphilus IPT5]|uniref:Transcriptional regulatory protein RXT2 N-terminal domain-containing protein n=1 Tax=Plenodomus tracheiphilus IPT5 TaxID=1408161 RepID=A0A6A7BKP6_9PLEO|nr:hypothetical protein T440DRAFT_438628 [Plenodomus tracheiphilus IPT5]
MAGQQQQIMDTIFAMKRKMLRKDDSDTEEDSPLNSNKQDLRRKVHYPRASDPDFLSDPRPYKKRIEHAGYHRSILQRNPPRYDPDGDIVEPDDEYDEDDDLEPVEENPYGNIRLESVLAPLTSAADLANHPALHLAYTSKHLTDLASEAGTLSRKEQATIARAKALAVKLQGDSDFAPAALAAMSDAPFHQPTVNGTLEHASHDEQEQTQDGDMQETIEQTHDVNMENAGQTNGIHQGDQTNGNTNTDQANDAGPTTNSTHNGETGRLDENGDGANSPTADDVSDTASQQTAHRMTTRARAHAASTPSPPLSPSGNSNAIHPLFTFSTDSLPDRDFGLPPGEAEETRMLLMAYIQKQEEIARITSDVHHGLLQADRMRQDVYKWSKAEAHVGEMSDGEDWYDNEEWGLEQDLVKGRDEEDDETAEPSAQSSQYLMLRKKMRKHRRSLALTHLLTRNSHVFCTQCADSTGLSRSSNANRTCPACSASLHNPDDVVIAGLNPSEDYKTSVLSGLSPTVIMECASRGLAFHSYQTSQEIIYQQHLAKGLTEKYNVLSQQMDQLIHDANAQIKAFQDKMHGMQAEQASLVAKNEELVDAFQKRTKAHSQVQKMYQALKAQVMASQVANAAGDEAEHAINTARGDRFIDRLPGTRTGTANLNRMGNAHQGNKRTHDRNHSRSSGSSGQPQPGAISIGPPYPSHLQDRGLGSRVLTGQSAHVGTPAQAHRSRLPVLGGSSQNPYISQNADLPYQASPMARQPLVGGVATRQMGNAAFARSSSRRNESNANAGPLGR